MAKFSWDLDDQNIAAENIRLYGLYGFKIDAMNTVLKETLNNITRSWNYNMETIPLKSILSYRLVVFFLGFCHTNQHNNGSI